MKLFVDLDGVLTDFDKAMSALMGEKLDRDREWGNSREVWKKVDEAGEPFWTTMEWQPGGKELWESFKEHDPTILSSPTRHESSKAGKRVWVKENLGEDTPVILESKKEKHASPDAILVDDRKKNIDRWIEAGGKGVLHKDVEDTLKKVQELMSMEKEAFKVEKVKSPTDPSRTIVIEKIRGGRGTRVHPDKTKYDRRTSKGWKEHLAGCTRVVLSYLSNEDFKFRAHPVVIDPYDAIVQQAIQQMGPGGRNIDVVKLEMNCPGDRVAWVSNEDFFKGKKDKKRVVHLCLKKVKDKFNKTHGKTFSMTNTEDAKKMRDLVTSYLRDVVLPHEGEHINQEVKGKGTFGTSPEVGAERAEDWSKVEQMGFGKKDAGFFPENYDSETGKYTDRKTISYADKPARREAPFSFKRLRTENLNYVRKMLLGMKDPKATKLWGYIESGLQGEYSLGQEQDLKKIIESEAREYNITVGELVNNLFNNKTVAELKSSPIYQGISRKLAREVVLRYAAQQDSKGKKLIIMRGISGTGKSTLAKELEGKYNTKALTSDEYFMKDGKYVFDVSQLAEAHAWNQQRAKDAMRSGDPVVIVDNTNTQAWEMKPYVLAAKELGYTVEFKEPGWSPELKDEKGRWNVDFIEKMQKSKERSNIGKVVPKERLEQMRDQYQYGVTEEDVLKSEMPSDLKGC